MSSGRSSVTHQAIRAISAGAVASLLVPQGFKRQAPHFWRETDGIYQAVNFQASQWGTSEAGQFTINLGISSPVLYRSFTGRDFPRNPGAALWPICNRIGGLMPARRDLWWDVAEGCNLDAAAAEVTTALRDFALPFFDRIRTAYQFNTLLLSDQPIQGASAAMRPLVRATLEVTLGRRAEARHILHAALRDHLGKPFEASIRAVAERLEISLEPD